MGRPPTAADVDVLRLAAKGLTSGQIATQLGVSAGSVKGRFSSIGTRIGVSGREEILNRVFEVGLEMVWSAPANDETSPTVDAEMIEQLLTMARMIVTDQPLGQLRQVAQRALTAAARRQRAAKAA